MDSDIMLGRHNVSRDELPRTIGPRLSAKEGRHRPTNSRAPRLSARLVPRRSIAVPGTIALVLNQGETFVFELSVQSVGTSPAEWTKGLEARGTMVTFGPRSLVGDLR